MDTATENFCLYLRTKSGYFRITVCVRIQRQKTPAVCRALAQRRIARLA